MLYNKILNNYDSFKEHGITNRFFKHGDLTALIAKLPPSFDVKTVGKSFEGKDLKLIIWGSGPKKVFFWSQMHGDEATGTMAIFDFLNLLQHADFHSITNLLSRDCTLYLLPMVNPDGAERFTRRNAQQIDINRDFRTLISPEASILKNLRAEIKPHFGFNLHDQSTLWSVKNTGNPATLSFLAPAYNKALKVNTTRNKAMLIIADLFQILDGFLPDRIGLFDDEYEPRAFGDNFQAAGTSTILIEAGGLINDEEKQKIRKYFLLSLVVGVVSIQSNTYKKQSLSIYRNIPKNNKEIFHILIQNITMKDKMVSIGICYNEEPEPDGSDTTKVYTITDIGDLNGYSAYRIYNGAHLNIIGKIEILKNANFSLTDGDRLVLSFENGILRSKFSN